MTHSPKQLKLSVSTLLVSISYTCSRGYHLSHGTKIGLGCADPMIIILVPLGEAQKLPCIVLDCLLLIRRSKPSASREIVSAPGENSVEPSVEPLICWWLIMAYEVWDSSTAFKTSVDSKWNFIDANTMSAFLLEGCEQQNIRGSSLIAECSTSAWGRRVQCLRGADEN